MNVLRKKFKENQQIDLMPRVDLKATPKVGFSKKVQSLCIWPCKVIEKINTAVLKIKRTANGYVRKHVEIRNVNKEPGP